MGQFDVNFKVGIIKDLHKQNLITENQMKKALFILRSKENKKEARKP